MIKKIITYISVLLILLVSSCTEKLNIDPRQSVDDQNVFSSVNMLENAVTGTYDAIQGNNIFGLNSISLADLRTQHMIYTGSWIAHRAVSIKAITTDNTAVTGLWSTGYACINATNRILKAVDDGIEDPLFDVVKDRVAGEAYFIRGIVYYELVKNFAKPYNAANLNSAGVPLMLAPTLGIDDAEVKPARESVGAVYAQIISDLELAYSLLPETGLGSGRANKDCAAAFLTRVYSSMDGDANWEKVIEWSANLASSPKYGLDDDPSITFGDNFTSEMIFGIANTSTDNVGTHLRWIYSPYNRGEVQVPASTMALYDATDKRRNVFIELGGKTYIGKYIEDKDNIPLMRIADIYLLRAEAFASLGSSSASQLDESLDLLNLIRTRAGLVTYSGLTQSELLERIKEETIKEFIGEGHAFFDLIRWEQQIGYSSGQLDMISWDDPRNIYPIPQRERDVNENLTQNEGY